MSEPHTSELNGDFSIYTYRSLVKEHPWEEHLASSSKRGVGALSNFSAFDHERASMSCLVAQCLQSKCLDK